MSATDTPKIIGHRFQPYMWAPDECGYIDGDDMMCGYAEDEHADPEPSP